MKKIPYTDANFIKSISYYQESFAEIEKENFESISYENMKKFIEKDKKIPLLTIFQPYANFSNRTFYRIRKLLDFKEDKNLVSSFGLPPEEYTKRGRANFPFHPVLYLSFLPQTPCKELDVSVGDEIFLTQWELKQDKVGLVMYLGERNYMDNSWKDIIKKENEILSWKLKSYNTDISASISYVKNKLSTWFLADEKKILSSFLGHYSLYDTNLLQYGYDIDGIIYPSTRDGYKGLNLALSKKVEIKSN